MKMTDEDWNKFLNGWSEMATAMEKCNMKKKKDKLEHTIKVTHPGSEVKQLRAKWEKKGYDLINITSLCELKLGRSGWCNGLMEPDEEIYHVKLMYRDENIAVLNRNKYYVIDDDKYLMFTTNEEDITGEDFIVFRKIKEREKTPLKIK